MPSVLTPLRIVLGLAATAAAEAKNLPRTLPVAITSVPLMAVSTAMQASLHVQQRLACLATRGDAVLMQLRGTSAEAPEWATFDDPPAQPVTRSASPRPKAAFDRIDYESVGFTEGDSDRRRWDAVGIGSEDDPQPLDSRTERPAVERALRPVPSAPIDEVTDLALTQDPIPESSGQPAATQPADTQPAAVTPPADTQPAAAAQPAAALPVPARQPADTRPAAAQPAAKRRPARRPTSATAVEGAASRPANKSPAAKTGVSRATTKVAALRIERAARGEPSAPEPDPPLRTLSTETAALTVSAGSTAPAAPAADGTAAKTTAAKTTATKRTAAKRTAAKKTPPKTAASGTPPAEAVGPVPDKSGEPTGAKGAARRRTGSKTALRGAPADAPSPSRRRAPTSPAAKRADRLARPVPGSLDAEIDRAEEADLDGE